MLHSTFKRLATGTAIGVAALVVVGGAGAANGVVRPDDRDTRGPGAVAQTNEWMAAEARVRPDDRAAHGPGAIAAAQRDVVLRPDDRADRRLPNDAPVTQPTTGEGVRLGRRRDRRRGNARARPARRGRIGDAATAPDADGMSARQEPARLATTPDKRKGGSMKLLAIIGIAALSIAGTAVAALTASAWTTAQKIDTVGGNNSEVNTPSLDGCPIQSPDGLSLYIASNRPGGKGGLDIWVATRSSDERALGAPAEPGRARELGRGRLLPDAGRQAGPVLRQQRSAARSVRAGRHLLHPPQRGGRLGGARAAALQPRGAEQRARRARPVVGRRQRQAPGEEACCTSRAARSRRTSPARST